MFDKQLFTTYRLKHTPASPLCVDPFSPLSCVYTSLTDPPLPPPFSLSSSPSSSPLPRLLAARSTALTTRLLLLCPQPLALWLCRSSAQLHVKLFRDRLIMSGEPRLAEDEAGIAAHLKAYGRRQS